jgi:hypothetical protein
MRATMTSIKEALRTAQVFLVVVFLGIFGMAVRNISDPDLWWHLKTGQFIAEHGSVPHADPFSYTRAGQPWVAHEWLTELFLYELQRTAGSAGLIVTFAAIISAAFFLLYLRCGRALYVAGAVTLFAAWATAPVWGVRPQVLSLLLTNLWLLILDRSEQRPKLLWWTLPLTLLWVNLHAGFALGLALSALFLMGGLLEYILGSPFQPSGAYLRSSAPVLLLNFFIVPLNPNGLHMFVYPIETLRSAEMQRYIAEWASPNFHRVEYWLFLMLVLVTFIALGWSSLSLRPRDLLLLLVSLYAGLCSIRLTPLFVLIAAPLICQRLRNWPRASAAAWLWRPMQGFRVALNGAVILAMATFVGLHAAQVVGQEHQSETRKFPFGAVGFLRDHPATGPIFNDYDWGGFLIWKLYPTTRVFIDGRADLYAESPKEANPQSLLEQFAKTYQFKNGWQEALDHWNVKTVLVPPDSAIAVGLRSATGWKVIYEDSQAVILSFALGQPTPNALLQLHYGEESPGKLHCGY